MPETPPLSAMTYYVLDDKGNLIIENDYEEWVFWMATNDSILAQDIIGETVICTSFLGFDSYFPIENDPLVFAVMISADGFDEEYDWYSTMEEALREHEKLVYKVKNSFH